MKILFIFMALVGFLFASVDINKADQKELETLSGIGAKKAVKIILFREKNGCFKSVDELTKVKGIGSKTLEKNRENLTLSECP